MIRIRVNLICVSSDLIYIFYLLWNISWFENFDPKISRIFTIFDIFWARNRELLVYHVPHYSGLFFVVGFPRHLISIIHFHQIDCGTLKVGAGHTSVTRGQFRIQNSPVDHFVLTFEILKFPVLINVSQVGLLILEDMVETQTAPSTPTSSTSVHDLNE